MNDILDYLTAMREQIDEAIIATSQGDDTSCIKHADKVFELYKKLNDFYTKKIRQDIQNFLRNGEERN